MAVQALGYNYIIRILCQRCQRLKLGQDKIIMVQPHLCAVRSAYTLSGRPQLHAHKIEVILDRKHSVQPESSNIGIIIAIKIANSSREYHMKCFELDYNKKKQSYGMEFLTV